MPPVARATSARRWGSRRSGPPTSRHVLGKIERDTKQCSPPGGACVVLVNFVITIIMLAAFVATTTGQQAGAGRQDAAGGATSAADARQGVVREDHQAGRVDAFLNSLGMIALLAR